MMFLLRMAFWLGVVLVLLPSGGAKETPTASGQSSAISTSEAVSAASATVSDMRHFCARQPDACAVGAQAAVALSRRAQAGAKMVLEFLNDRYGSHSAGSAAPVKSAAEFTGRPSQNTLTPADLSPGWRGPQPSHKEGILRRPA